MTVGRSLGIGVLKNLSGAVIPAVSNNYYPLVPPKP
jgi:hypothetical protein